jgi:hypothetical protein
MVTSEILNGNSLGAGVVVAEFSEVSSTQTLCWLERSLSGWSLKLGEAFRLRRSDVILLGTVVRIVLLTSARLRTLSSFVVVSSVLGYAVVVGKMARSVPDPRVAL